MLRNTTDDHRNAHFNMIDRVVNGPNPGRDEETVRLLDAWLLRPRRDFRVDLADQVQMCGDFVCQPVAVDQRPPTDFLWQRSLFQVRASGSGLIEDAGIDYIIPYWMARYYGIVAN